MKFISKLLILLLFVSCAASKQKAKRDVVSIYDIKWHVESLNGELVELPENSQEVYIIFKAEETKQISGNNSCNSFFGGYEIIGDSLKLTDIMQTLRACQQPFAEIETKFMEALYAVESYKGSLRLFVLIIAQIRAIKHLTIININFWLSTL